MSAILLLLIWLILLFVIAFIYFRDVMAPAFLMCGTVAVLVFLFICSYNIWPNMNYDSIVLPFGFASTAFLLGSVMGRKRPVMRYKKIYRENNLKNYNLCLSKNMMLFLCVITYTFAFVTGTYKYALSSLYKDAGTFATQLMESNSVIEILHQIVIAITYIILYSLVLDVIQKKKKNLWLKIMSIIPYNVICLITGTRFAIFVELMFIVGCVNFIYRLDRGQNIVKMASIVLKAFFIIVIVFVGSGYIISKISATRNIFIYVLKYLTVGIFGFTRFINNFEYLPEEWGAYSFNNVYRVMNLFGMGIESTYSTIGKHYYVNEIIGAANLYTGYMNLISDFGYYGAIIVTLILGYLATRAYYSILYGERKNMIFAIIFYSSAMYLLVAIWIEQNPLNMLLSSSYVIRVIMIFFILKLCQYFSKKNPRG